MQTDLIKPTLEMVAFYERRTNEHIDRVHKCLTLLADATIYRDELIERAKTHDASKFGTVPKFHFGTPLKVSIY